MTASRDPNRLIRAFLNDGPEELADRSYDAVRSQIDRTRQRAVIGPWEEPRMSNFARLAIAAAAVLVVGVVGYNLLPGGTKTGGPQPAASPTPSPAPAVLPLSGEIAPGSYYTTEAIAGASRLTLTVPAGWSRPKTTDTILIKNEGTAGEVNLNAWIVTHVFADVCHWSADSLVDAGTTADQLVSALVGQKGRQASTPSELTLGGFPAKRVELSVSPSLDVATCTDGNLRYWPDAGPNLNGGMCCNRAGNTDVVYAVDAGGKRLVYIARYYPGSTAADKAELQAIVDSIQITP
jgi:hypothetical protein